MKSNATLTSVMITMILAIAIFTGMFIWLNQNATDTGQQIDSKYGNVYNQSLINANSVNTKMEEIRDDFSKVKEADSVYSVAINGFKGLGNILLLPVSFIDYILSAITSANTILDIPSWVKTLLFTALLIFLVFLIVKALKGESGY